MGKITFKQFIEIFIFCLSNTPKMERICTGVVFLTDEEFVDLRCIDAGCPHQLYLMLIGAEVKLTDELESDKNYTGLNNQASIQATLINDLYRRAIQR